MKKLIFSPGFAEDLAKCEKIFGLYGLERLNYVISVLRKGHKLHPK
jgi:hypothetical protein